jgi:hypothetical protein
MRTQIYFSAATLSNDRSDYIARRSLPRTTPVPRPVKQLDRSRCARRWSTHAPGPPSDTAANQARPATYSLRGPHIRIRTRARWTRLRNQQDSPQSMHSSTALRCGRVELRPWSRDFSPRNALNARRLSVSVSNSRGTSCSRVAGALTVREGLQRHCALNPNICRRNRLTKAQAAVMQRWARARTSIRSRGSNPPAEATDATAIS